MEDPSEGTDLFLGEAEWREELKYQQSQVNALNDKLIEVKANLFSEDDSTKELEHLCRRVKTVATLLTYLKSKARIMAIPHLAYTSCGIKHQDGVGFVDKNGVPIADWSKEVDASSYGNSDDIKRLESSRVPGAFSADEDVDDILKSVRMVTEVMESLVKRVMIAEAEASTEKEKVKLGLEEINKKTVQIETMSVKFEEMEKFALGTNSMLNEMRQRVEDMVQETTRQRQRAAENEQELCRVKQDFEALRSYVNTLTSVRETLLSSERQFQTIEKLFDRLVAKTSSLENEKAQKESEVHKLMQENVRLRSMVDQKEAQLLAMTEQCKFMALNNPDV